jgi:hypothetical protein
MIRFIKKYMVELIAGVVAIFGVFLMVERLEIRVILLTTLTRVLNGILSALESILLRAKHRATVLTPSDALGFLLIVLAVGFIIWRIRFRFHTDSRWGITSCPKCSSPLKRVHRSRLDRALGAIILPEARRYRCVSSQCYWSGLLRRDIHHPHHHAEKVTETENL